MQITIEIPDEYIQLLEPNLENFSQRILETLVVEAYKAQNLTSAEVGRILNLNRFEVDAFLKQHGAYLHYTITDFKQDLQTLQHLQQQ
jgi:predicted HTH domain antitoxin